MQIDGTSAFIPVSLGTSPSQAEAKALLLPELQKLVPEASATDVAPKGFPKGVSWTDAYKMVTEHAATAAVQNSVLASLKKSLRLWTAYRDAVVKACGIKKGR